MKKERFPRRILPLPNVKTKATSIVSMNRVLKNIDDTDYESSHLKKVHQIALITPN
jgi:hypothetical protein